MSGGSFLGKIEIDLKQFERNLEVIREMVGKVKICLPVKWDAYGHGMVLIAKAAEKFGVDLLAVSSLEEGAELRKAGIRCPIAVLGAIDETRVGEYLDNDLELSISSKVKAELIAKGANGRPFKVHLDVETGLCRTGMRPETVLTVLPELKKIVNLKVVGVYSHLATADKSGDSFAEKQIKIFGDLKKQINDPNILWHIAASGGTCFYPSSHFDMVRPGLICFGISPDGNQNSKFQPILSLKARISFFKVVGPGTGVSFDHLYKSGKQTRIVTVPIGYGDGFPNTSPKPSYVLIRGKRYPIVGKVCADQLMVDIGDDEAYVGEEVTLIGCQEGEKITISDLATAAGTSVRELLFRFNDRLQRVQSEALSLVGK